MVARDYHSYCVGVGSWEGGSQVRNGGIQTGMRCGFVSLGLRTSDTNPARAPRAAPSLFRWMSTVLQDFDLDAGTLEKVNDFVDDDLLSCFLWAAGENAVAQPGWESPSVNPLKGIPLPPLMPPLPPAVPSPSEPLRAAIPLPASSLPAPAPASVGGTESDDDDLGDLAKMGVPMTKEEKLTQRMQRKAESARVARLRKKDYVSGLEEQIKALQCQVEELRARQGQAVEQAAAAAVAQVTDQGGKHLGQETTRHLSHMDHLLKQPSVDRHVPDVNAAVENYVANKRAKQETINEYLDCIEDYLSPAAPLQVAFDPKGPQDALQELDAGTCDGGNEAPPEPKRQRRETVGSQLISTLSTELGLTAQQVDLLSSRKESIRNDREIVAKCHVLLNELRHKVAEHTQTSQSITDGLRRILTPVQVAKFLMWVEKNQKSMDLLNTMLAE